MDNHTKQDKKTYPEGHFIGIWTVLGIVIFSGLSITYSAITENFGLIGIGPAIGTAFGFSIGQSIENKYIRDGRIRLLTEAEKRKRKNAIIFGIILLSLGLLVFSIIFILK
ncbi:hypothetical protein ACFOSV_09765 [Algoriphagus namhaensis]|uniref:Uncharacterized protein n=1 Tax=Algoriphagus namhaensis TaxID=915353 RepID=A0ABV8AR37_9BACT